MPEFLLSLSSSVSHYSWRTLKYASSFRFLVVALANILVGSIIYCFLFPYWSWKGHVDVISTAKLHRVTIWNPPACHGHFVSEKAHHSTTGLPYVMIRDAVIDRRLLSNRQYREVNPHGAYLRIILYASVHLSVSLTKENATVDMLDAFNKTVTTASARVDYVKRVDPFLLRFPYKPGRKTTQGRYFSDFQIAMSFIPKNSSPRQSEFEELLHRLASNEISLHLSLLLKRFDGVVLTFKPLMELACITGWERRDVFPTLPASAGALLVGSKALNKVARSNTNEYFRVAHFGARALLGPLRYDVVALPVLVDNSVSDRSLCPNATCHAQMEQKNWAALDGIRNAVEKEFEVLRIERELWSRFILLPFCRLGTNSLGSEKGNPCGLDHQNGQYHTSFFTFTMLSQRFKWVGHHDIDEFIASSKITLPSLSAKLVFDHTNWVGRGVVCFTWLDALLRPNMSRQLTIDLMQGKVPSLKHKGGEPASNCHSFGRDPTGKCAVRSDVGLGFTIHAAVVRNTKDLNWILGQSQKIVRSKLLRTWHARLSSSRGKCEYVGS